MRIYNRIRIKLHGKGLNGNLPFYCFIIQFFYSHSSQNAKQFIYKDFLWTIVLFYSFTPFTEYTFPGIRCCLKLPFHRTFGVSIDSRLKLSVWSTIVVYIADTSQPYQLIPVFLWHSNDLHMIMYQNILEQRKDCNFLKSVG